MATNFSSVTSILAPTTTESAPVVLAELPIAMESVPAPFDSLPRATACFPAVAPPPTAIPYSLVDLLLAPIAMPSSLLADAKGPKTIDPSPSAKDRPPIATEALPFAVVVWRGWFVLLLSLYFV